MPNVYASLPLSGPARHLGRELLRGAELALERAADPSLELLALDSGGEAREQQAVDAARRAARDPDALAYLGDVHSRQVAETSAILGPAGLLQVAPVATWVELGGPTLVRLMPHDGVGAAAIADWLVDTGVEELLVVHDHDPWYGVPVGGMCADAARAGGLAARSRPIWDHDEDRAGDIAGAGAVLYVGVAGSGAVQLWQDLHTANPDLWLLGTEGVAAAWVAEAMSASAADRDSLLGRYSLDAEGHTTMTAYGRLAVIDGELVSA
jgi:branched-chain amino acid transport system substrate-binding protein